MKRLQTNGQFVILPGKNPFARGVSAKPFSPHYLEFAVAVEPPPHTHLGWTVMLADGHTYLYTYTFAARVTVNPDMSVPNYWFEQVSTAFFWFQPAAKIGGEAYNASVRQALTLKTFLF
jgi:hypothetical protein